MHIEKPTAAILRTVMEDEAVSPTSLIMENDLDAILGSQADNNNGQQEVIGETETLAEFLDFKTILSPDNENVLEDINNNK